MAGAGKATSKGRIDPLGFLARFEPQLLANLADRGAEIAKDSLDYPGPQAPSNPGEAPNSQEGLLYEGIGTDVDKAGHTATVFSKRNGGNTVPLSLEEGTPTIAPRPYMSPAYEQTRFEFDAIVEKTKKEI